MVSSCSGPLQFCRGKDNANVNEHTAFSSRERQPTTCRSHDVCIHVPRRVDGTYVKKTRPVEGPTFNGANKILEIIVTPEPTPNPPLHIMKSPEHLGFGSNYRSLYFIFGLKVRPKMLAAC